MRTRCRACAMCVKEIALPDEEDENEDDSEIIASLSRMKLRERKTLERQLIKEEKANSKSSSNSDDPSENREGHSQEDRDNDLGRIEEDDLERGDNDEEDDDPFLKAVGGADQLLTGEAYQRKLLLQQEQRLGATVIGSTS